jgi:hypothetical protein
LCWLHDPINRETRRRITSKAGRSRPSRELASIKARLSALADDVLTGTVDKGVAAVASQVLNVYLRAVSVELKVNEQRELIERLARLEEAAERKSEGGSRRWGA